MGLCQLTRGVVELEGIRCGGRARNRDAATVERGGHTARQDYEDKYTHPELREEIKEEIKASDRGGEEGQWSARKSQLLTQEYEKRGGGYKGEKGESQKDLEKWSEEEWQTREGDARQDGETKRYLPKKAWENMSEEASQARKQAAALPLKDYDDLDVEEVEKKAKGLSKDEIRELLDCEKLHKNRKTLVHALDRKL